MTTYIKKSVLLCSLLMLAVSLFAASEAEYGKLSKAWALNADGSQEYRYSMELTLFTHTAMNSTYGESFIIYNPDYQELTIHTSYTKQKDGTIIKTPENAFVEVLPRYAVDAPAHNRLKEMVVVHTGLELGATIYLDYSVRTKAGYYPALDLNEFLQETSPVKEYKVTVSAPDGKPLNRQLYASAVKATETVQGGVRTLSWTLRNIPASSRESFLAQNRNDVPRLVVSTYDSTNEALAVLNKRFNDAKAMEPETYAEFITEEAKGAADKVSIIQKYVVNELATVAIPLSDTGYTVRNGEDVVRSAYGTVAEKTQVLCSMLNAASVQASVVALYPATLNKDAYGLSALKGLLVKATVDGKDQYLSATSLTAPTVYQRAGLDRLCTLTGEEISLTAAPVTVDEKIALSVTPDKAVNGYVVCDLKAPATGVDAWNMSALNTERTQLFETPSLLKETVTYTVSPATGMKLRTKVADKTIRKPFGSFSQSLVEKDGKVEVTRSIELNKMQFTPAEYADLRVLITEWMNPAGRVLLFSTE